MRMRDAGGPTIGSLSRASSVVNRIAVSLCDFLRLRESDRPGKKQPKMTIVG